MKGPASRLHAVCVSAIAVALVADPGLGFAIGDGAVYRVSLRDSNDIHGNRISRSAVVVGLPSYARPD